MKSTSATLMKCLITAALLLGSSLLRTASATQSAICKTIRSIPISFNEPTYLIRHRNDTLDIVRSRRSRLFRTGNAFALFDLEEKFALHNRELTSHFKWVD